MKKRSADFHFSRIVIVDELSQSLHHAKLGRYQSMMSCAVRPERYSELIVHLCVFQLTVRDRYPKAEEAYLAIDIFDYHSPQLRRARMRKLLNAGLSEYWAFDLTKRALTTYRNSSGRIIQREYNRPAKVSLDSFPDVEIDLHELLTQGAPQKYGRGAGQRNGPVRVERAEALDGNHSRGQE